MSSLLASIPSPSTNVLEIGPLSLRAYGVCIALGVLAAVALARKRWADRGGSADDMSAIALWAVPAGLIGARLYHVVTDWHRFTDDPLDAFLIWQGGLGIPGGILVGTLVGVWVARRRHIDIPRALDAVAPALPLAQAIGRLGNWFNQELYGRPSDLPWALEIDADHRPAEYAEVSTFHPTFLYEASWNLALVGALIWIDRSWKLQPGRLFALYVAGYALGRLWVESLRIDEATMVLGVRVNIWVSLFTLAAALIFVMVSSGRSTPDPASPGTQGNTAEDAETVRDDGEPRGDDSEQRPSEAHDAAE